MASLSHIAPRLLLAGVCLWPALAHAAADEKLKAAATQAQPAVIESLREMVLIESGSSDAAGLKKMADYTETRLKALGATTERRKATAGVGADIVIGTLTGTGTKKIMLIAHMDTVYQPGILQTQPWKIEGNKVFGPGIADDKGGIAVILHALAILKDAGWRDYAKITVLLNPDEEVGSIGSGELIASMSDEHDYVLSCEPTAARAVAGNEGLLLGASGTATATMEVTGRASHAGAAPQLGRNALIELSHQLLQTRDVAKEVPGTQLNWTTATAGNVRNQIPDKAVAGGDVRVISRDGVEKLQAALQAKVDSNKLVPDTTTVVTVKTGRPPFVASSAGRELAKRAQAIYGELDRPLGIVDMTGGGTDAGFANRGGKAVVVESFGLAGHGYHARDEYIDADSIVPRLYLMTRMLTEIGKAN
jgi:glutamate carboxypeptidase